MDDLRRTVLQLILKKPDIKSDEIYEHPTMADEESKRISNFLYIIKKDGLAVADEGRHYSITAKGRAYLKDGKDEPAAATKTKHRASPAAVPVRGGDGVEQILVDAEEHAQGALDRYLTTVGDPGIINPLRAARDSAREALKNYRGKQ